MQSPRVRGPARDGTRRSFGWDHLKLAHTILDDEALDIFRESSTAEMSATELSRRSGMPLARCYRWLRKLESLGLIVSRDGPVGSSRAYSRRYRSAVRSIHVSVEDDRIGTRIEVDTGGTPIVSEWITTIEGSGSSWAPEGRSRGRAGGANVVLHFVDPPRTKADSRRKFPINLPAFLDDPLSLRPERR
jgi:IclR helix-turn-helix domain